MLSSRLLTAVMASAGSGSRGDRDNSGGSDGKAKENVADLMLKLNLTEEEEAVLEFSDDEEETEPAVMEFALVGKVLSPSIVNVNTIRSTMKPAWGNPYGMKVHAIREKTDNMFVAEFGCKAELERVMLGSPWMVGRHAVILQPYDERLSASEIVFDRMEIWVRLLNLPLGWMNRQRGGRAMGLLGNVVKMDVDGDGKLAGRSCVHG